jgi:lipopolysaccharide/colanic/teichoic acid biosynthesis glycosyltransferase
MAPVLALIAIAIKLADGGPVLIREGAFGLRFRTTVISSGNSDDHETHGPRLRGRYDQHLTRLGRFLRHYSLDELPGLWSVLIGKASLEPSGEQRDRRRRRRRR